MSDWTPEQMVEGVRRLIEEGAAIKRELSKACTQLAIVTIQRDELQAKLDEIEKKREEDRLEYLANCP